MIPEEERLISRCVVTASHVCLVMAPVPGCGGEDLTILARCL